MVPWNKGKTAKNDSRIFSAVSRNFQKKLPKPRSHEATCKWCKEKFETNRSRHWTCPECSKDKKLRTRAGRYGLTTLQVNKIFSERDGLCILCERKASCVDHNHETKIVRGVLCNGCNLALSRVESQDWLVKALKYLKRGLIEIS